jgi:hypothetical protein
MLMPNFENQASRLSNAHPDPNVSDVHHSASRTFTTNQPALLGASPDPASARGASGTLRVYTVTSDSKPIPSWKAARIGVAPGR